MKKPDIDSTTVDVIIPTYNGMPWLKQTIQSIQAQTHKNLFLYVIDDGSTDDTGSYVKNIKDKRIKYLKKPNGGQATARNYGIKHSSSPYIAFIDSDDVWYPEKLSKQLKLMVVKPQVGMVYGHHYVIDEEGIVVRNLQLWKRGKLFNELLGGNYIAGSASMVLIRRSVFEELGLFHEDFLIGEDWEMWLRISQKYEIDFVPEILAALRALGDGMQTNHKKMSKGLVHMYKVMKIEFALSKKQRRRLANACLLPAADGFLAAGARGDARRTILLLFRENYWSIFNLDNWPKFRLGLYLRVLFGNQFVSNVIHGIKYRIRRRLKKAVK